MYRLQFCIDGSEFPRACSQQNWSSVRPGQRSSPLQTFAWRKHWTLKLSRASPLSMPLHSWICHHLCALHTQAPGKCQIQLIEWNSELRNAFQNWKEATFIYPIFAFLSFDLPFIVEAKASYAAIGATLAKMKEDRHVNPIQSNPNQLLQKDFEQHCARLWHFWNEYIWCYLCSQKIYDIHSSTYTLHFCFQPCVVPVKHGSVRQIRIGTKIGPFQFEIRTKYSIMRFWINRGPCWTA